MSVKTAKPIWGPAHVVKMISLVYRINVRVIRIAWLVDLIVLLLGSRGLGFVVEEGGTKWPKKLIRRPKTKVSKSTPMNMRNLTFLVACEQKKQELTCEFGGH
jgi:hypothetical protein